MRGGSALGVTEVMGVGGALGEMPRTFHRQRLKLPWTAEQMLRMEVCPKISGEFGGKIVGPSIALGK